MFKLREREEQIFTAIIKTFFAIFALLYALDYEEKGFLGRNYVFILVALMCFYARFYIYWNRRRENG